MREPPARVRFIGHPIIATPILGVCGFGLYAWSQHAEAWVIGLIALAWAGMTLKACETMKRYRDWHRAWDSMAEPVAKPATRARPVLGALLLAPVAVYLASNLDQPGYGLALGCTMLAGIVAVVAALAKRWPGSTGRPRVRDARDAVTVAVTRPILPVPGLVAAYDALPAYCWHAIDATRK